MSGFENYAKEIDGLDQEIRHYAAVCGVDLANRHEVDNCLHANTHVSADEPSLETLRGLLLLRLKVETEMIEQGITPPPLLPAAPLF